MLTMNTAQIAGHLTGDPRTISGGARKDIALMTVAVNDPRRKSSLREGKDYVDFIGVKVVGNLMSVVPSLTRGTGVIVTGRLSSYTKDAPGGGRTSHMLVLARDIQIASPKGKRGEGEEEEGDSSAPF